MQKPQGPFCQSCGMPMQKEEDFGTEADGSRSEEYCCYCYQKGKFTNPNCTLEEMVDLTAPFMAKAQNTTVEAAKEQVKQFLPMLKRWKQ